MSYLLQIIEAYTFVALIKIFFCLFVIIILCLSFKYTKSRASWLLPASKTYEMFPVISGKHAELAASPSRMEKLSVSRIYPYMCDIAACVICPGKKYQISRPGLRFADMGY